MTFALTSFFAAAEIYEPIEFAGWEVVRYYYYLFQNFFSGYSWQVVTAYNITVLSSVTLVLMFCLFWLKVWKQKRIKKKAMKIREEYQDKVRYILGSADVYHESQILEILEKSEEEVRKNDPRLYAQMLEKARMDMYEIVYLPNMQVLSAVLGVTEYFEQQLLLRKNIFYSLQILLLLQIKVSEGRLANYVNHKNKEIRMMARLCYICCSSNEPYRYLREDLNEEQAIFRPMLLNYIFGWMKSQDKHMPNFLNLAERTKNETSAAYLVREVAYWGSDHEKEELKMLFLNERLQVRQAAIEVVAALHDVSAEDKLKESYFFQPEHIRREILRALLSMQTGKQLDFFLEAYEASTSRETREVALSCIYKYGNEGRRQFEIMRSTADEETRRLIDQVDSIDMLAQLQTLL